VPGETLEEPVTAWCSQHDVRKAMPPDKDSWKRPFKVSMIFTGIALVLYLIGTCISGDVPFSDSSATEETWRVHQRSMLDENLWTRVRGGTA